MAASSNVLCELFCPRFANKLSTLSLPSSLLHIDKKFRANWPLSYSLKHMRQELFAFSLALRAQVRVSQGNSWGLKSHVHTPPLVLKSIDLALGLSMLFHLNHYTSSLSLAFITFILKKDALNSDIVKHGLLLFWKAV